MSQDRVAIKEALNALVIRPRSVRRTHEQVECQPPGESARAITGALDAKVVEEGEADATRT